MGVLIWFQRYIVYNECKPGESNYAKPILLHKPIWFLQIVRSPRKRGFYVIYQMLLISNVYCLFSIEGILLAFKYYPQVLLYLMIYFFQEAYQAFSVFYRVSLDVYLQSLIVNIMNLYWYHIFPKSGLLVLIYKYMHPVLLILSLP